MTVRTSDFGLGLGTLQAQCTGIAPSDSSDRRVILFPFSPPRAPPPEAPYGVLQLILAIIMPFTVCNFTVFSFHSKKLQFSLCLHAVRSDFTVFFLSWWQQNVPWLPQQNTLGGNSSTSRLVLVVPIPVLRLFVPGTRTMHWYS